MRILNNNSNLIIFEIKYNLTTQSKKFANQINVRMVNCIKQQEATISCGWTSDQHKCTV